MIERFVDFDALRADKRPIFIAATNVQTGRLHIFRMTRFPPKR